MSYISAIRDRDHVRVWERDGDGKRVVKTYDAPYYFFTRDNDGEHTSMFGEKLVRHEFTTYKDMLGARQDCESNRIDMYESDISPELKILSEHYYGKAAPILNITFLDIEVDYKPELGFSSVENPYAAINAIALYHTAEKRMLVYAVPPGDTPNKESFIKEMEEVAPLPTDIEVEVHFCKTEAELLMYTLAEIEDSDLLSGWNSDAFDMPYIAKRIESVLGASYLRKLCFPLAGTIRWRQYTDRYGVDREGVELRGRTTADYLQLFMKYEVAERPSYKLETIAEEVLPELLKLEYDGSLADLYQNNFAHFVRYNLRDTEILKGFEDRLGYVELANQMYHISTGDCRHIGGTLKLAELAINNFCIHELDLRVPDNIIDENSRGIQGAYVLLPTVGMHGWVGSMDINSLYPSAIRSINISPETLIGQFRECERAVEEIKKESLVTLTLEIDGIGDPEEHTADEWRTKLKNRGWAVSGYGTVFNQAKQGVIPSILKVWYDTRKKYQKLARESKDEQKAAYYDRLQYIYKIKLNSLYGALNNRFFRYHDARMGESTTGTGRMILRHMCAQVCKELDGEYTLPNRRVEGDDGKVSWGYTTDKSVVYGDSVAGDTLIETAEGPTEIQQLFTKVDYEKNEKQYCNVNNYCLTYVPINKRNEFRPIKYVMRHKTNKQMYRVWIGNTRYIDVTEDHSLIGYANTKSDTPGLVEVKPNEIGTNNVNSLLLCSNIPSYVNNLTEFNLSSEMCQLIGYIIGDGHVEKNKASGVGLSTGNQDKREIIKKLIVPLIEQGWFTSYIEMKNGHDIRLCGVKGYKFLRKHLYPQGKKQFPMWTSAISIDNMRDVLKGYFSADGFANKNKTVGLCSTNKDFIIIANRLLKLCGISSNYWTETTENSFKGKYSGTYTRRLTVYNAVKFGTDIGFIQTRKNRNVRTEYSRATQHQKDQSGYVLISPTKIERIPSGSYVYDVEIEDIHTFFANDLLVHNTDSTYFLTHQTDKESAVAVADLVAEKVTNTFQEFMQNNFLCTEGFDNLIKAGREVVSSNGLFVDKKRYILQIVDNEGVAVDKLKVMGLDTKKTTMPFEVSKELNNFIGRLLKGEDWDIIANDIVEYKEKLRKTDDIMTIGLPRGIKKVAEYTDQYNIFGAGVRLPGHVAAAIHYNECLKRYDDRDSIPIVTGMKIKVFYLTKKVGRFKSCALPTDTTTVPEWFLDHYAVDRDAHITRLVDKPLGNILKAINVEVPSKQSLIVGELLDF